MWRLCVVNSRRTRDEEQAATAAERRARDWRRGGYARGMGKMFWIYAICNALVMYGVLYIFI